MTKDILSELPARHGHFLLESGLHTDLWLTLDELFIEPAAVAPLSEDLAERLRPHHPNVVCGPLLGGAFLAQILATVLDARFCYTEPRGSAGSHALFAADYRLPPVLRPHVRDETVAVVDDVVSAGSSVRATVASLEAAGATVVVIGALLVLGERGARHFHEHGIPLETVQRRPFATWTPDACPLCHANVPLEDPRQTDRSRDG